MYCQYLRAGNTTLVITANDVLFFIFLSLHNREPQASRTAHPRHCVLFQPLIVTKLK